MPRLTPAMRATIRAWHARNPLNAYARPLGVFPSQDAEGAYHRARCSRLIALGALVPDRTDVHERQRAYRVADWALADALANNP